MGAPSPDYMRASFTFTDGLENVSTNTHFVYPGILFATVYADLDPLYEAMQACSDAAMEKVQLATAGADPTEAGAAAAYSVVEEKATLLFQAADNSTVSFDIPAPDPTMFAADEKTVDPTQGIVATLITEVLALVVTRGGEYLLEYIRGYHDRGKPRSTKPGVTLKVP